MKLIIGLGNIGTEYKKTRHNIGFMQTEAWVAEHGENWTEKPKFKAHVAEINVQGEKVIVLRPTTFYNLCGEAVRAVKDFYKLENSDILVVHDELALPFGTIRARIGGSDAGNNGIKSVSQHIGQNYARIRIGIANEFLTPASASDFVLGRLSTEESKKLPEITKAAHTLINSFVHQDTTFEHTSITIAG